MTTSHDDLSRERAIVAALRTWSWREPWFGAHPWYRGRSIGWYLHAEFSESREERGVLVFGARWEAVVTPVGFEVMRVEPHDYNPDPEILTLTRFDGGRLWNELISQPDRSPSWYREGVEVPRR